ncbi:MAG: hypothetical protein IIC64_18350 [SAR324 cluster bacterium]|nr:hypothetical protein [SAR324 cluster bacterium]
MARLDGIAVGLGAHRQIDSRASLPEALALPAKAKGRRSASGKARQGAQRSEPGRAVVSPGREDHPEMR